ncbi:hypothetical protein DSO57_1032628 [Entomophthora muscae]|uniref:Uncharacterized protein n=1 Tax=Entomophthora muscae TaxID=34485 RepID=A0ACC2T0I1_9FUNG|nr:hypothetical protein DSO57_1032628 [Entomophthora muscae]
MEGKVFQSQNVRNIPDTYSCVTNKLSPAINVKVPATTKQTSDATKHIYTSTMQKPATTKLSPAVNVQAPATANQTSAAIKQIHVATTQKSATTKLLPAVKVQAPAMAKKMHTATTPQDVTHCQRADVRRH